MGTRGKIIFKLRNKTLKTYRYLDGYPSGLGLELASELVDLIKIHGLNGLNNMLENLRIVQRIKNSFPSNEEIEQLRLENKIPTLEELSKLKKYNQICSECAKNMYAPPFDVDWLNVLNKTLGSITLMIESGYILEYKHEADYTYEINLVKNQFEMWHLDKKIYSTDIDEIDLEEIEEFN